MTIDKANHLDVAPSCLSSRLVKVGILRPSRSLCYRFYPSFLSPVDRSIIKTDWNVLKDKKIK